MAGERQMALRLISTLYGRMTTLEAVGRSKKKRTSIPPVYARVIA